MQRLPRTLAVVALSVALLGACGGRNPYQSGTADATVATTATGDNVYLPDRDVSDCVGTLERPDCGSSAKGRPEMYLVLGVLVLGLTFVGWRVVAGVRRRDAVVNAEPSAPEADSGSTGE
jgi:hypothetical protein